MERSRSLSSSFFYFFTLDGKGRFDDLEGVDCNRVGKGGSRVLIPDLVVIAKVGASGSGNLLSLIVERIWKIVRASPYGAGQASLLSPSCVISYQA
ncbi:hypothetical protein Tco_0268651 [Tanacetum coccineum]